MYNNDTDGDGISDGVEVKTTKTDPTKWSSRDDNISDLDWYVSQQNDEFKEGYDKIDASGFNVYIKNPEDRMFIISKIETSAFDNLCTITEPYQIKHFSGKIALNLSGYDASVAEGTKVYKVENNKAVNIERAIEEGLVTFEVKDGDIFVVTYEGE